MTYPKEIPEKFSEKPEKRRESVLTGIQSAYTVSATPETNTSEVDEIMIKEFLQTLADISLAIASRNSEVSK